MSFSIRSVNLMGNRVYLRTHSGQLVSLGDTVNALDGQAWKVLGGNAPASSTTNGTVQVQHVENQRTIHMETNLLGLHWA